MQRFMVMARVREPKGNILEYTYASTFVRERRDAEDAIRGKMVGEQKVDAFWCADMKADLPIAVLFDGNQMSGEEDVLAQMIRGYKGSLANPKKKEKRNWRTPRRSVVVTQRTQPTAPSEPIDLDKLYKPPYTLKSATRPQVTI